MTFTVRIPQIGAKGNPGNLIIEKTNVAPGAEDGAVGDMAVRFDDDGDVLIHGKKTTGGWPVGRSIRGPQGFGGWSPILTTVIAGSSIAIQLVDWVGGSGDKPTGAGSYIGPGGLVADINDAQRVVFGAVAENVFFDPSGTGLMSEIVQDALVEIATALAGKQPFDAQLTAIAGLAGTAGSFTRWTGAETAVMQPIVGPVSEAAGVPTGALFSGWVNTANGKYRRSADGWQECIKVLTGLGPIDTGWGAIFQSAPEIAGGDFAAAFVEAPTTSALSFAPSGIYISIAVAWSSPTPTTFGSFSLVRGVASARTDFVLTLKATGRWF